MSKKYNCGSFSAAIRQMADDAIRDREMYVRAITPRYAKPDAETQKQIDIERGRIADYKRIARTLGKERPNDH